MKFNPSEYIDTWNTKITAWQKDYLNYYNNDVFKRFLKNTKSEEYKMQPEFLIEPYIGDINNCSAVFINKNPGQPIIDLQHWKTGGFLTQHKAHKNYYNFSKNFPYLDNNIAGNWWDKRVDWINRLANIKSVKSYKKPFALEICPYHSKLFKTSDIIMSNDFLEYIKENIIQPAEFANKKSELGVILSVGNTFEYLYDKIGFKKIIKINQDNYNDYKLEWSFNIKKNLPIKNEYNLWQSKTGAYYLNFVHGSNYNKPPVKKWHDVEIYIIHTILNR